MEKPTYPLPPAKVQAYADTNGVPPRPHRLTVNLDAETYASCIRAARANRISVSAAAAGFLADFRDAIDQVSAMVETVRTDPAKAVNLMQRQSEVLVALTDSVIADLKSGKARPGVVTTDPPSSNTGGIRPSKRGRK